MKYIIVFMCLIGLTLGVKAQEKGSNETHNSLIYNQYKTIVESGNYLFTADWVMENSKRKTTDYETNALSFSKDNISGNLKTLSATNPLLAIDAKGIYGMFYSDENQLIKVVYTVKNNAAISTISLEIKNEKVFLRIEGKDLNDLIWIGKLTEL